MHIAIGCRMEYNENRKTIITEEKMMEQEEKKNVTQNAEKYIRDAHHPDSPLHGDDSAQLQI